MAAEALHAPARFLAALAERVGERLVRLPLRWRLAGVVLLAALQLAVPVRWILGFEQTLAEGRAYRFRAAPVDPADPLRGRYVVLGFEAAGDVPVPAGLELGWNEEVWVPVFEAADGFARLGPPARERPEEGDFLRARVSGFVTGVVAGAGGVVTTPRDGVRLALPFDRFFLEEGAAPAAEALLREAAGPGAAAGAPEAWPSEVGAPQVWAQVRVRDGQAVLEEVLVDGVPLRQAVARHAAEAAQAADAAAVAAAAAAADVAAAAAATAERGSGEPGAVEDGAAGRGPGERGPGEPTAEPEP